ncbi:MAG: sugar transferase [Oscillospiraceae bacterium]
MLISFAKLPERMQNQSVKVYYDILAKKRTELVFKRLFDILVSFVMLVLLSPLFLFIAVRIKLDSSGPVFFRQKRFTSYMREFQIFKFRSMVDKAELQGPLVTVDNDSRITEIGKWLRGSRMDEIPQLINILLGDMSFVGTRPEVGKYVEQYNDEMLATLLMPAGVTSLASIKFKDEADMLENAEDADEVYVKDILPLKMKYNLEYIKNFGFLSDIKLMLSTVKAVSEE